MEIAFSEFIFSKSSKDFLSIFRLHFHLISRLEIFTEKCLVYSFQPKFMLVYLCFYEEIRATYCVSISVYKIVLSSSNPVIWIIRGFCCFLVTLLNVLIYTYVVKLTTNPRSQLGYLKFLPLLFQLKMLRLVLLEAVTRRWSAKNYSVNFRKIQRKSTTSESLFHKVVGLRPPTLSKWL